MSTALTAESLNRITHHIPEKQPCQVNVSLFDLLKNLRRQITISKASERRFRKLKGNRAKPELEINRQMTLGRHIYGPGFGRNGMAAKTDLVYLPYRWGSQKFTGCYKFIQTVGIESMESNPTIKVNRYKLAAFSKGAWADFDAVRALLVATENNPVLSWPKPDPFMFIHPSKLRFDRVILNMVKSKSRQVSASALWTPAPTFFSLFDPSSRMVPNSSSSTGISAPVASSFACYPPSPSILARFYPPS